MRVLGYRPRNRWVRRPLDWGWLAWLQRYSLVTLAMAGVLVAFVGPRQSMVRSRYLIARLNAQIDQLEAEHQELLVERERLASPPTLAAQLDSLQLVRVSPENVLYLQPDGRLRRVPPRATPAQRTTAPTPRKDQR